MAKFSKALDTIKSAIVDFSQLNVRTFVGTIEVDAQSTGDPDWDALMKKARASGAIKLAASTTLRIDGDADYFEDQRLMNNPKRKDLREKLEGLRKEIVAKEAELGRALESKKTGGQKPDEELKTVHRRSRRDIKKLKEKVTRLENRLAHTPTKVPASELTGKKYRATMRTERRNLVNAIKIATYNAERLLARRFFKHYKDPRDWLTIFRSILQLPGTITNKSTDEIVVELRPPDQPKVRHALALTLAELNALGGRTFGDGQRITFALKS